MNWCKMNHNLYLAGSLFTRDYLNEAIQNDADYAAVDVDAIREKLREIYNKFPTERTPSEAQTEDDLIWPILAVLGWDEVLRQQNLAPVGRDNVPDGLLFLNAEAKSLADKHVEDWKRYNHGVVVVESKRWDRALDRGLRKKDEATAPSTQMLRYLRRVDDLTSGNLRWGFLTNGAVWRLYYQGARSVSEQFFELDLAALLKVRGDLLEQDAGPEADDERDHLLRVFVMMFRRASFAPAVGGGKTFHLRALDEGKFYEERVAKNLSDVVFQTVFPLLAKAIAVNQPSASLQEVRHAALILLYRLLFLLYAEDRNLLPVRDKRFDDYALRENVRGNVGKRKDENDTFSTSQSRYWAIIDDLSRAIDKGDTSIGLPAYNGGLFNRDATPLLATARIADDVMADVIDLLSFERIDGQRRYINYRDLSVQQLGSIYERLLEFELSHDDEEGLIVRPNLFARKSSGSYYTPDELVGLILRETLEPLITDRTEAFNTKAEALRDDPRDDDSKIALLHGLDPAEALLGLRIVDPAMGSGHFLVNLVDFLSDTIINTMAEATSVVDWAEEPYISPLANRIADIRNTINRNADANNWTVDIEQLDDRHIIRRMVLKRCVYGVDKNQMAVELAKVALWLHSFTVGAPLSFLDHHLRCGDSLFGETVGRVLTRLNVSGQELLIHDALTKARSSAASMTTIEGLTDAEIAEAHQSADIFAGVVAMTDPLDRFMKLIHAIDWLGLKSKDDKAAIQAWLDGQFGDPIEIARGKVKVKVKKGDAETPARAEAMRFAAILDDALALVAEERFMNWEVAFPGVWRQWDGERTGGFDAVIGNPPWDRIKLQEVEWFGLRDPKIALAQRASDRGKMIKALEKAGDPLFGDYLKAKARAEATANMARKGGFYPLLSGGDINLYSLFVERAMNLLSPTGMMGLLTPSGIASDKTASTFFKGVATTGRLKALYDFENKKIFFPDVHASFKFCAFIGAAQRTFAETSCAFYIHNLAELENPDRCFPLSAEDFARVNPNTGTAPVFRNRRDAELITRIYRNCPVFCQVVEKDQLKSMPLKFGTMFHMQMDSGKFETEASLERDFGAWKVGKNEWESDDGKWIALFQGRQIEAYDHRFSGVGFNEENLRRGFVSVQTTPEEHKNPDFKPRSEYFVKKTDINLDDRIHSVISYRRTTATTNARTLVSAIGPRVGYGDSVFLLIPDDPARYVESLALTQANLMSIPLDFVSRSKVHGQNFSWYLMAQLPVISSQTHDAKKFGTKTASEVIKPLVLELTYTAHDMAPFARDMGHVDAKGDVLPPFSWDEDRRLRLRAKLDAVFFHLYGLFDADNREQSRDDISYIYSTFPIVEKQEMAKHGCYLSRDLALAYCNTLAAGHPDAEPEV